MNAVATRPDDLAEGEIPPSQMLVEGHALQTLKTTYATAQYVQRPRSIKAVTRAVEDEAALSGDDFFFSWRQGKGDVIEGVSIKGAMILARCWGNCAVEALPVQETPSSFIFTSAMVDLETGFTLMRQFRMSKAATVHGKHDEERKADMRFQIGQSKAHRNVVLNAVPAGLVRRAMEAAKSGATAEMQKVIDKAGIAKVQDVAIKKMSKAGVKEDAILRRFEVAARSGLSIENLVLMQADLKALESGEDRPESLYPATTSDNLADKVKAAAEAPKPSGKIHHVVDDIRGLFRTMGIPEPDQADWIEMACPGTTLDKATPDQLAVLLKALADQKAREDAEGAAN